MRKLGVKATVGRKEESARVHRMPTVVTFVRHSTRSLAKTHVQAGAYSRLMGGEGEEEEQDCGVGGRETHILLPPHACRHHSDNYSSSGSSKTYRGVIAFMAEIPPRTHTHA